MVASHTKLSYHSHVQFISEGLVDSCLKPGLIISTWGLTDQLQGWLQFPLSPFAHLIYY